MTRGERDDGRLPEWQIYMIEQLTLVALLAPLDVPPHCDDEQNNDSHK